MTDLPGKPSEETNEKQLRLAKKQGDAYKEALKEMAENVAQNSGMQEAGDYLIAYCVEEAEGFYFPDDSGLQWHNPEDGNVHIEVAVADSKDGRFIPYLKVKATLFNENDEEIDTKRQPFLWHPWLHHYGRNWSVPKSGTYTLEVAIEPPEFGRHDRGNGNRYLNSVEVRFKDVNIETGQRHD